MITQRPTLAATKRDVLGKRVARLRREGLLPAVVYGHGVASQPLSLDGHEFELLHRKIGQNALVDLSVEGTKATPVLVHGIQRDPVYRRMLHVDLLAVRMTEELTVDVPLVTTGESVAVEKLGGTLLHMLDSVRIRALPDHLPQSIDLPIDSLVDFEATVHVRDLTIPPDVTLLTDPDEIVARVQQPRIEEEEPVVAAEEGEEEGGEAAEGAPSEEGQPPTGGESEES
ncbi:MAG: large subunit ribosomal protein [Chloroflexota bacterium]|jgi:large subunit ribosomal protein L25|nr:large subunit ribosomal protein [Chloroflexota bacterium]